MWPGRIAKNGSNQAACLKNCLSAAKSNFCNKKCSTWLSKFILAFTYFCFYRDRVVVNAVCRQWGLPLIMVSSFLRNLRHNLQNLGGSKHFQYGVPFLIFVVGSSFAISGFSQVRYTYRRGVGKQLTYEENLKYGVNPLNPNQIPISPADFPVPTPEERKGKTLEEHYQEYLEKREKDPNKEKKYEMIRGPRWYEPQTMIDNSQRVQQLQQKYQEINKPKEKREKQQEDKE